ncbi:uncharacterized protein si:ch211-91p5.3 isoform X2 [Triplophysa dalaica]|uniref:uncharacterized protein si:ch211-91p5.3 isoform X2 n=1 Tax=Triplophysa dalaica TaxID=1582913 RepID=UPI0024DF65B8|nr:uncharacterized protein si:ch211-91p5.3 isoform X2 [Triplophysa dalaica]
MTNAKSFKRFGDEKYKNWLKTAESLSILRIRMEDFIEKETETYHTALLANKPAEKTCKSDCYFKNKKAYMSRGHKDHCTFGEFDISAIFNLMTSCKHFKDTPKDCISQVIGVRNKVMHSPDFKMSNDDREKHLKKVLEMAKKLEQRVPKLIGLDKEIEQFNDLLDKNFSQAPPCEVDGRTHSDIQNLKEIQKVLDREQQAMKDKLEEFFLQFEGNQDKCVKEQSQDLLDFLDQNNLQENFGPQVSKLKEMQEKVDQHEQKISHLTERVDHLEQKKPDHQVLSDKPLKYKNHLFEFARKKLWPEPVFTEEREPEGYKAKVEVNGQTFFGRRVWNSSKAAHQEVANIALQNLQADNTEEPSSSTLLPSLGIYFGKVTVVLDREVASGGCYSNKVEAIESAFEDLWKHLQDVVGPVQGHTYKSAILDYFNKHGFQNPEEEFVQNDDDTTICKLRLSGPFTFHDTVGSTKKKQAEHQAAEVALKHLSKILNSGPISDNVKNFKGILKESLETHALSAPVYDTESKDVPGGTGPEPSSLCVTQASVKRPSDVQPDSISTSCQSHVSVSAPASVLDPEDSSFPDSQSKKARIDSSDNISATCITYFGKVTVSLDREIVSDGCCSNEKEASESAYKVLWQHLHIDALSEGQTHKSAILEYFNKHGFQNPAEEFVRNDDDTTICKLRLSGPFIFHDTVGCTKKKQAEQLAAKVALKHLSKILNRGPISETEKNFIGVLKESLETHALSAPVYDTDRKDVPRGTSPEPSNMCVTTSEAPVKQPSVLTISSHLPSRQSHVSVCAPASVLDPQDSSSPDLQRKKNRIDSSEIDMLLTVWDLTPPQVKVENIEYDENFKCTVEINLENFTFTNKQGYDTKKEAIRKTYMLFGCAMGIFERSIDEKTSSAQVKQHFSQKSLALPQEDFEGSAKPFCCSLKNITYRFTYEGQGPSEGDAKLLALKKALGSLSPLFVSTSLTAANSPEKVQDQLSCMLKGADQKDPVISMDGSLVKTTIQLNFTDHTVKCTCKSSKKAARNHLSLRILGLLGVKTDSDSTSLRTRLNEWFIKQKLTQPVFEDTEEALGAKATFSAQFTCCSPGWEDNWETSKKKLLEELKKRFQFLND